MSPIMTAKWGDSMLGKPADRPTVVLAEDSVLWEVGVDFGAALRRRGLRVVRLLAPQPTSSPSATRRRLTNMLCDRALPPSPSGAEYLSPAARSELMSGSVVDVQCLEGALDPVHRETAGRLKPPVSALSTADAIDKVSVAAFLGRNGVPTLGTVGSPDELGPDATGPFMVKQRAGAGGGGAVVCADLAAVRRVFDRNPPGSLIVQSYLTGRVLDSAGVARDGRVIQAATYYNVVNPADPYGAARAIVIEDIPDLLQLTTRVVEVMGINGPFAIDSVRDEQGQLRVIDVNLRIFGCWTGLQAAGIDVVGSYLHTLGRGPDPGPASPTPGARYDLIRFDEDLSHWEGGATGWLLDSMRATWARRGFLGARWTAITTARVGAQAARQAVRSRRVRRGHGS